MALLASGQIIEELQTVKGWSLVGNDIRRTFEFKDFAHAMRFVNSVALLAEKANHHPDIDIRWSRITLTLSTHSEGGLTTKDFTLAREIDKL